MSRFTAKAQSATSNSFITTGRNKISVDNVINEYPVITIIGFDKLSKGSEYFYAISFAEDNSKFFFAGSVLSQICDTWLEGYESCEKCSEELSNEGGVKIKMYHAKSKSNRDYIACEVIE